MSERIFIKPDQAISLLPEGNEIHTFINVGFGLVGADWSRDDIIMKIRSVDYREIAGSSARSMKHGLALWSHGAKQDDILFVETDMDKLDRLYPEEKSQEDQCPICGYLISQCQCRFGGSCHPDRVKQRQVVLDHLYVLSKKQLEHVIQLEKDWQTSYGDEERETMRKRLIDTGVT